jgi:ABC-type sugar transport system ATPase subunit
VSQELNVFPDLDLLANLFPMREPRWGPFVSRAEMAAQARPVLDDLGLNVPLSTQVSELTLAQRQLVEIARALVTEPRVLVLDEPTSALEASSTEALLRVLGVLRQRKVAVVFVSHLLTEVMQVCDEITVLRDGEVILSGVPRDRLDVGAIVDAMLGERHGATGERPPVTIGAASTRTAAEGLRMRGVSVRRRLENVDLDADPGEIVGLAGVAGSGHLTVLELLSGLRRPDAGSVALPGGRPVPRGLRRTIGAGVAVVSGDRRGLGLMLDKPVWENVGQVRAIGLAAAGPLVRAGELRAHARRHVRSLRIRTPSVDAETGLLSGGNQQKVVFAKWLDAEPSVLLLDDPTRGVDVGAKAEMHGLIRSAADAGAIVLLCSTDVDELADLCDRVVILHRHRVCAELAGDALEGHAVLEAMNTGQAA